MLLLNLILHACILLDVSRYSLYVITTIYVVQPNLEWCEGTLVIVAKQV